MKRRVFVTVLVFACISLAARAHEGMIHVIGTITALTDQSVTVQTADKKSVEVVLIDATTYEKASKPAARTDLKVGDRVVIHAVKVKDVLQAHDVRFNEIAPSSPH